MLAISLYLGLGSNILEQFPNDIPYAIRLGLITLPVIAMIAVIIYRKYHINKHKPKKSDPNSLVALLGDKKWSSGQYDPHPEE